MESREAIDVDFNRYFSALKRQWIPAVSVFVVTAMLSTLPTKLLKPSYESEGKLLFKVDRTTILTGLGEKTEELRPLVSTQNPISTEIEVIYSNNILQKTIDALQLKNKAGKPLEPDNIKSALQVKIIGGTDALRVSYKSRNPKEAAAVVNQIMVSYIENDILISRAEATSAREFIAKQLPKTELSVREAEVALRRFQEKNNVVALSEQASSAVTGIGNIDGQITTAQAQLEQANTRASELRDKVGLSSQEAMTASALSQSLGVQGILQELQQLDRELASQRSRFQEQHPTIVSLEARKATLTALLQQQIKQVTGGQTQIPNGLLQIGEQKQILIKDTIQAEAEHRSLAKGLASLYNSRSIYEQRINIIPQLKQNQRELERRVEAAQSTYETLLKKLQELQVAENKNTANARIIEKAVVSKKPISDKKIVILALGLLFGACLATTTVLVLEMRDRSLKTLKEVREVFKYPLLGIIPFFGKKVRRHQDTESLTPEIPVRDAPHSLTSEMFRMTQANLKFLSSDKPLKTIAIASSVPKEGKSTVSANLAAAMAQLGRRVLLIDADMRLPSQHHIWGLTNATGLSEVLVGQAEVATAVKEVIDNLSVLTAGVMPPNPLALLDSKRMASLIEDFSHKYDFVIIDAPPLTLAADALTLSQMTDGILLIARPGVVDYTSTVAVKEMLEHSGQNVLGLVVNGIIQKNESSNYFYHTSEYFTQLDATSRGKIKSKVKKYAKRR